MKKLISAGVLTVTFAGAAFGLSDSEYLSMKKSSADFAKADKRLSQVWKKIYDNMPGIPFKLMHAEQLDWLSQGRDNDAERYMKQGYSRTEAYTMATNDRADFLPKREQEILNMKE